MRLVVVALAAAALAAPAHALAATVHVEGKEFGVGVGFYTAGKGEANRLKVLIERGGQEFTVTDPGATIAAGDFCESDGPHKARCVAPPITLPGAPDRARQIRQVTVELGDGDDRLTTSEQPFGQLVASGGPGDDVLEGDRTTDIFDGGGGHDALLGGDAGDFLTDGDSSGAGDHDRLDGGGDFDTVSYARRKSGVAVDLVRGSGGEPGEKDAVLGIEEVIGGAGRDRISGTDDLNVIEGNGGDDTIEALGGNDRVGAGAGDDHVGGGAGDDSLNGGTGRDATTCGEGEDVVGLTTGGELLGPPCEGVGTLPGGYTLRAQPIRVSRRSVSFQGTCSSEEGVGFVNCRGTLKLHEAGGKRRVLARAPFSLDRPRPVVLRLNRLGRRLVARRGGVVTDVSYRASSTIDDVPFKAKAVWALRLRPGR